MSELTGLIESAQSDLSEALRIAEQVESQEDLQDEIRDAVSDLEDALSYLSRVEDYMPSRYTEVGDVPDALDNAGSSLDDAATEVVRAKNRLEMLLNNF